jgi:NADPH-dependent curcumin reductase CurA
MGVIRPVVLIIYVEVLVAVIAPEVAVLEATVADGLITVIYRNGIVVMINVAAVLAGKVVLRVTPMADAISIRYLYHSIHQAILTALLAVKESVVVTIFTVFFTIGTLIHVIIVHVIAATVARSSVVFQVATRGLQAVVAVAGGQFTLMLVYNSHMHQRVHVGPATVFPVPDLHGHLC